MKINPGSVIAFMDVQITRREMTLAAKIAHTLANISVSLLTIHHM
jgi:hypothetical protein